MGVTEIQKMTKLDPTEDEVLANEEMIYDRDYWMKKAEKLLKEKK